jgi:hypothetical protein
MLKLMQKNGWRLAGPNRLRAEAKGDTPPERALAARRILEVLKNAATA